MHPSFVLIVVRVQYVRGLFQHVIGANNVQRRDGYPRGIGLGGEIRVHHDWVGRDDSREDDHELYGVGRLRKPGGDDAGLGGGDDSVDGSHPGEDHIFQVVDRFFYRCGSDRQAWCRISFQVREINVRVEGPAIVRRVREDPHGHIRVLVLPDPRGGHLIWASSVVAFYLALLLQVGE
jgi:hypothetical protein